MMALASLMEEGGRSKQPPPRVYHLDVGHLHGLELSGSIITLARQSRKGFYTQKLCVLQTQEFCFWEGKNGFEGQLIISIIVQSFGSAIPPLSKVDNSSPNHLCLEAKAKITFGWSVVFSISSAWLLVKWPLNSRQVISQHSINSREVKTGKQPLKTHKRKEQKTLLQAVIQAHCTGRTKMLLEGQ